MKLAKSLLAVAGLFAGFYFYGAGRTMRETVGFTVSGSTSGLLVAMGIPLAATAIACLLFCLLKLAGLLAGVNKMGIGVFVSAVVVFVSATLLGSILSETFLLSDEAAFRSEIRRLHKLESNYSRPRVWPYQETALLYEAKRGIWATD